jgi:hypothetical protein
LNKSASSPSSSSSSPNGAGESDIGFFARLVGDGRPFLSLTGLALVLSGAFALFLSFMGSFLPHDVDYLGMTPPQLCAINQCRIVHFMFHDRVAFGGVLIAIGTLYLWLCHFPLAEGREWAWWVFLASGISGFASFLCYLGYGYLDTWHGAATLALLPCFVLGMWRTRALFSSPRCGPRSLWQPSVPLDWRSRRGIGRICLLLTGIGKIGAGAVIMLVGMSSVFVPQDLTYIGLRPEELFAINPRLVPLIAHDRAGFGGGLLSCGLTVVLVIWKASIDRGLWQALLIAGVVGFACAIGIHYHVGYTDFTHVGPAILGGLIFAVGMVCTAPASRRNVTFEVENTLTQL